MPRARATTLLRTASAAARPGPPPPRGGLSAGAEQPERLVILHSPTRDAAAAFADDVRAGLTAPRKTIPPRYFYDDLGSCLFEAICRLPEYYLTRAENEILLAHTPAILDRAWRASAAEGWLVELGAGSATKTRHLIGALLERGTRLRYLPIDISAAELERTGRALIKAYPSLHVTGVAAGFDAALARIESERRARPAGAPTLALFLGSTIGNLEPAERAPFLRAVRRILDRGDALLLGADRAKPAAEIVPGYDDALGVTAAFNLNLLQRINRELGGSFDLRRFRHHALYDEAHDRLEMHLVSLDAQRVRIAALGLEVAFQPGETIHTENSYKFSAEQLRALAADSQFELEQVWQDRAERFLLTLLRAL
jgi:dimethylhistidine N-methyltransferase